MAQLKNNPAKYILELDAKEYTLISRLLGHAAGIEVVRIKHEDVVEAARLNEQLLRLRLRVIDAERSAVLDAIEKLPKEATKGENA